MRKETEQSEKKSVLDRGSYRGVKNGQEYIARLYLGRLIVCEIICRDIGISDILIELFLSLCVYTGVIEALFPDALSKLHVSSISL